MSAASSTAFTGDAARQVSTDLHAHTFAWRRELTFQLFDVLHLDAMLRQPRFGAESRESAEATLDAALALAEQRFAPCAAITDAHEPQVANGRVVLPPQTAAALSAYAAAGFPRLSSPKPLGGLGMPHLLSQGCGAAFAAANVALYSYAQLNQGVANLIVCFGSDAQRERYLASLFDGRSFGTMCISEPEAGSSLSELRTRAEPIGDGLYRIRGRKAWVSGGHHELSENIVHLVLARTADAPAGARGLSLFIVPRRLPQTSGAPRDNDIALIGLDHKMGWRAQVSAALAFGENAECLGERVGREHAGLGYMFHALNEARIGAGLCAGALGYEGFVRSLDYARARRQGRPPGSEDEHRGQVALIEHADVRRMLISQKVWSEGSLALALYCASLVDEIAALTDDAERTALGLLLDLLTPIAKSWPSEWALEANKLAIQVAGGAGYTRELAFERLYRDNRLTAIHEGTFGIQGLDLLGRKVRAMQGGALRSFVARVRSTLDESFRLGPELVEECKALSVAVRELAATTRRCIECADAGEPARALADATIYLDAFGTIAVAWRVLAQANVARRLLAAGGTAPPASAAYLRGKVACCRWFFARDLPRARIQLEQVALLDDAAARFQDGGF